MTVMECLAMRLRETRRRQGLSQYRLAQLSGVAAPTINRVENRRQQSMSVELVRRLARALGVDVDYLVGTREPDVMRGAAELVSCATVTTSAACTLLIVPPRIVES